MEPGPGARCQLPRAALVLAGVFAEPGLSPFPSLPGRGPAARPLLGTPRLPGQRVPQASGLLGARRGGGTLAEPSFQQPGESPEHPQAGERLGPCRCLPAGSNPATARPTHRGVEIPAKSRPSELSILIEIAGLGTAGGRLYRFDLCCSGEHITTE